jgi:periplasmic protein TonB
MPRDLFACPPDHPESRRSTRLLPVSILLHAVLIGGAIIAPLLAAGDLPKVAGTRTPPLLVKTLPSPEIIVTPARRAGPATAPRKQSDFPSVVTPPSLPSIDHFREIVEDTAFSRGLPGTSAGPVEDVVGGAGRGTTPNVAQIPSGPVRPGGGIERPKKIRHVAPAYPDFARQARVQGTVVIDAIIGPDGHVTRATIRQSQPLLDQAALAAVRQWVYTPTKLNGTPIAVIMTVEVNFRLQ